MKQVVGFYCNFLLSKRSAFPVTSRNSSAGKRSREDSQVNSQNTNVNDENHDNELDSNSKQQKINFQGLLTTNDEEFEQRIQLLQNDAEDKHQAQLHSIKSLERTIENGFQSLI